MARLLQNLGQLDFALGFDERRFSSNSAGQFLRP